MKNKTNTKEMKQNQDIEYTYTQSRIPVSENGFYYRGLYKEMTTEEQLKYNQLKNNERTFPISVIYFPFEISFWVALFVIAFRYAYDINFRLQGLLLTSFLFKIWFWFLIAIAIWGIVELTIQRKKNRKLLIKIYSERK